MGAECSTNYKTQPEKQGRNEQYRELDLTLGKDGKKSLVVGKIILLPMFTDHVKYANYMYIT